MMTALLLVAAGGLAGGVGAQPPQKSPVSSTPRAGQCPPLDAEGLTKLTAGAERTDLVFFASWCGECAEHLRSLPPGAVVVAAFDERGTAEAALGKLGIQAPCYTDAGVAERLGVKAVPAEVTVGPGGRKL